MEPRSQLENADQVCIRCQKELSYAGKLKIEALKSILKYNKENKVNTYIHLSCHNSLKNKSHTKRTFKDKHSTDLLKVTR